MRHGGLAAGVSGGAGGTSLSFPSVRRAPPSGTVLAVASLGALLAFVDSTIVNVAFPSIQRSFPTSSLPTLSWVLNGYNIVLAALLVIAGRGADLLGIKRTFLAGIGLFTLASAACAAATSPGMLIGFRLLQGGGAALLIPASLGLVVHAVPAERRAHAVGLWGATAALAAALGPPIGGALVSAGGWRWAFVVNVPLGVAAVLVARARLVESRAAGRRRLPDLRGALLLGAALGLATLAVVQGGTWGWTSPRVLGAFAAAAAAVGGFVLSSRAHPAPVLDPALLRQRAFVVANVATVVLAAGWYAYILNHILWLRDVWGYSLLTAGLAVAPGAVVAAVTAGLLGRVAERIGYRWVAAAGALVWAVALGWWYPTQIGLHPDFLGAWLPGQLITGLGVGAAMPTLAEAALHGVPGRRYATASAVNAAGRQLGAVLGVALLVVIIGTPHGAALVTALRDGWRFSGACFLVGAVIAVAARVGGVREEPAEPAVTSAFVVPPPRLADKPRPAPATLPLAALADAGAVVDVAAGEWLFRQGDPADGMYVVRSGRLQVVADGAPSRVLGAGDPIGELALLTGGPRSAGVRALRDSRLTLLSAADFQRRMLADPAALLRLTAVVAERLASLPPPPAPEPAPRVLAVTGADPRATATVAGALAVALGESADATLVSEPIDADGLRRAEREQDFVVLCAGAEASPWREFCLRNADRTVLVVDPAAPAPDAAGEWPTGGHLVWADGLPERSAVQRWHDAVSPLSSHRVALSAPAAGLRALAERLTQRSPGLVLAGGGAPAFAHLGVLEVLEGAGVRFERVAGTSLGALVGVGVGLGLDAAAIDAYLYAEFVRRHPFADVAPLPRHGLLRGRRVIAALRRTFGDVLFEELPAEFACVSTDLLARAPVVHRRGPVWEALAATTRLPVIFPPLLLKGALHIDGTVLDNLPVAALAARAEGPIIAVDIGVGAQHAGATRVRTPAIGETLLRTVLLAGSEARTAARERAAVTITPRTAGIGLLEWHQIDAAKEAGRRAAEAALPAVLAALNPPRRSRVTGAAPREQRAAR